MVSLTAKGRAVVDERTALWHARWEERLGALSEKELTAALRAMRTITELLDDV